MRKCTLLLISALLICSCLSDEEIALREKVRSDLDVPPRIEKASGVVKDEYADCEKRRTDRYINDLEMLAGQSFDRQLDRFDRRELGFFRSYKYMFQVVFLGKQQWSDNMNLVSRKYFNSLDIEQEASELFTEYSRDIGNLRIRFNEEGKVVKSLPELSRLALPDEEISLSFMRAHARNDAIIEFGTDIFVWLAILLVIFIISLFIEVPTLGWSTIALILSLGVSVFLTHFNDKKVIRSIRDQHVQEITTDFESLRLRLYDNTDRYYNRIRFY